MTRRLFALCMAVLLALPALCQESDNKKINKIKRDNQYLYDESTMKDPQEAYESAMVLLNQRIDEYVKTKKKFKSSDNIIIKDIASKSERIQMPRGELTRVFVYVKKSDIIPAENSTMRENAGKKEDPEPEPDKLKSEVTPITPAGDVISGDASLRLSTPWQQEVIDQLLACTTLIEAKALLNRQKAEYKVKRIGSRDNCRNAADCFWVVGDAGGSLVTVLGPGSTERTNFRTLQRDALENFGDATALWFIMAK